MIYAWQTEQWQQLWQTKQAGRMPHALLFTGAAGMGKAQFAESIVRMLLCQNMTAEGNYCNKCHACRLISGRAHPNLLWIEPEKEGSAIKVDQIREVSEFINQSSLQGEHRVVIINPANDMNVNAANALLKTLEEPSSGAIMILISNQLAGMPATILSRCQRITFSKPARALAADWLRRELKDETADIDLLLNLANGAPLAAKKLFANDILVTRKTIYQSLVALSKRQTDPLQVAAAVKDIELIDALDFLINWTSDILRAQIDVETITNMDFQSALQVLSEKQSASRFSQYLGYLQQLRTEICRGFNFNKQLLLETLFIKWMKECT